MNQKITSYLVEPELETLNSLVNYIGNSLKYKVKPYSLKNKVKPHGESNDLTREDNLFKWKKEFILSKRRRNVKTPIAKRIGNVIRYSRERMGFDYLEQNEGNIEFIGGNETGTYVIHVSDIEKDDILLTIHFTDEKMERMEYRRRMVQEVMKNLKELEKKEESEQFPIKEKTHLKRIIQ